MSTHFFACNFAPCLISLKPQTLFLSAITLLSDTLIPVLSCRKVLSLCLIDYYCRGVLQAIRQLLALLEIGHPRASLCLLNTPTRTRHFVDPQESETCAVLSLAVPVTRLSVSQSGHSQLSQAPQARCSLPRSLPRNPPQPDGPRAPSPPRTYQPISNGPSYRATTRLLFYSENMAQRLGRTLVDPDGDAFMADDQAEGMNVRQGFPPHSYCTNWPNDRFQFHQFPSASPRLTSASNEDRLAHPPDSTRPASRSPTTHMRYPSDSAFEPYYPPTSGHLRYLPPPNPNLTSQPRLFRPLEISTHSRADLPSGSGSRVQAFTRTAETGPPTALPPLATVVPSHTYLDPDRNRPTPARVPRSQSSRDLDNTGQQASSSASTTLRTRETRELIGENRLQPLHSVQGRSENSDPEPLSLSTNSLINMADSRAPLHELWTPVFPRLDETGRPLPPNPTSVDSNAPAPVPNNRAAQPNTPRPRHRHRRRMSRPSSPRVKCSACMEDYKLDDLLNLACTCRYCHSCLNAAFQAGCTSKAAFPPKCCGRPLRISVWGTFLDADVLERYKMIEAEFSATRPLYCAVPTCSAFISEEAQLHAHEVGVCPECNETTCVRCRHIMKDHPRWDIQERVCPTEDAEVTALFALGSARRWIQCPTCLNMVSRSEGCNHMDCVCGVEFCYRCGNLFGADDSCGCDPNSWEDDEDDGEEDNDGSGAGDGNDEEDEDIDDDQLDAWPNIRVLFDAAGKPACLHRHTESLGDDFLPCHGCLERNSLRSCDDCQAELCQTCLDSVRDGARSPEPRPGDGDD